MAVLWSDLPDHLWCLVLKKLDVVDFYRFGVVCSNWRSLADSNRDLISCKSPWLMLPNFDEETKKRSFLRLTDQSLFQIHLPEVEKKHVCGCSHGWLITADYRCNLHLLNPFTRVQIPLPRLETLRKAPYRIDQRSLHKRFFQRAVLSSDPNQSTDYVVIGICCNLSFLVMCRAGEECWTAFDFSCQQYTDVVFWQGRFYALNCYGTLLAYDLTASPPTAKEIVVRGRRYFYSPYCYLVKTPTDLLVVSRCIGIHLVNRREYDDDDQADKYVKEDFFVINYEEEKDDDDGSSDTNALISNDNEYRGWWWKAKFCAFKLNQVKGKWQALKDLGDSILFLSECSSLSLSSADIPCPRDDSSKPSQLYVNRYFRGCKYEEGRCLLPYICRHESVWIIPNPW